MLAVQFHIGGVCWLARHAPHRVDQDLVERHETQMQVLLPQMGCAMAVLAALDLETHHMLQPWTDELDRLDGDVARLLYGLVNTTGTRAHHHAADRALIFDPSYRICR